MSEIPYDSEQNSVDQETMSNTDFDPVCVDIPRIYDSCGAKDCLRDLPVFYSAENQELIESAASVRITRASVITSNVEVDPVAFHRGFYSVDVMFYFAVCTEVFSSAGALPVTVNGLAVYGKRVVLYGSDSNVRSYSSDEIAAPDVTAIDCVYNGEGSLPTATVHVSSPMALAANLSPVTMPVNLPYVPEAVLELFGGALAVPAANQVLATIGIFTIIQLSRNVQMMIPSYDFCVPRKECSARTDDPCEAFSKIEFPTDAFFPPTSVDNESAGCNFNCGCES